MKEHDDLLLEYCRNYGGTTFANVKLEGDPYPNPRQIDGVRFPPAPHRLISWTRRHPEEFQERLSHAGRHRFSVEVIEVTTGEMDRGTVGQVVVGAWLLEQHKVKAKKVLVCTKASAELKALLLEHDIHLWSLC